MASRRLDPRTVSVRWNVLSDDFSFQEDEEGAPSHVVRQGSKRKDKSKKGKKSTIVDLRALPDGKSGPETETGAASCSSAAGPATGHTEESLPGNSPASAWRDQDVRPGVPGEGVWKEVGRGKGSRQVAPREVWGAKEAQGLAALKEMFGGGLDAQLLEAVYRQAEFSVEAAAEMLLAMPSNAQDGSALQDRAPPECPIEGSFSERALADGAALTDKNSSEAKHGVRRGGEPVQGGPAAAEGSADESSGDSGPANQEGPHPWDTLPLECQLSIFELLTTRERARAAPVCRSLAALVKLMRESLRSLHLPSRTRGGHLAPMVAAHPNLRSISFRRCGGQIRDFISIFAAAAGLPELAGSQTDIDTWEIDDSVYMHRKMTSGVTPAGGGWQPQALSSAARQFRSSQLMRLDGKDGRWITPWLESDGAGGCWLRSGVEPVRSLRAVDLHRCKQLEDEDVAALCLLHGQLEEIDLSCCENISDRALNTIAEYRHFPPASAVSAQQTKGSAGGASSQSGTATWHDHSEDELPPEVLRAIAAMDLGVGGDSPEPNDGPQPAGLELSPEKWPQLMGSANQGSTQMFQETSLGGPGSSGSRKEIFDAARQGNSGPGLTKPSKSWSDLFAQSKDPGSSSQSHGDFTVDQTLLGSDLAGPAVGQVEHPEKGQVLNDDVGPPGSPPLAPPIAEPSPSNPTNQTSGPPGPIGEGQASQPGGRPQVCTHEEPPAVLMEGPAAAEEDRANEGLESFMFLETQAGEAEGQDEDEIQGPGFSSSSAQAADAATKESADPNRPMGEWGLVDGQMRASQSSGTGPAWEPRVQGDAAEERADPEPSTSDSQPSGIFSATPRSDATISEAAGSSSLQLTASVPRNSNDVVLTNTVILPNGDQDTACINSVLQSSDEARFESSTTIMSGGNKSTATGPDSIPDNGSRATTVSDTVKHKARSPLLFDWLQEKAGDARWRDYTGPDDGSDGEEPMEALAGSVQGLKTVQLAGCEKISEVGVKAVLGGTVEVLNVSRCPLLANSWLRLPAHSRLRQLSAAGLSGLTKVTLLVPRGTPLEEVSFNQCPKLSSVVIHSRHLRTLSLGGCSALSSLALLCPALTSLTLSHCTELRTLGQLRTPALRSLNLYLCTALGGASFATLETLDDLEEVNCTGCRELSAVDLGAPGLRRLSVAGCLQLTRLVVRSPRLEQLDGSGCAALRELRLHSPRLRRLAIPNCAQLRILALPMRAICEAAERARGESGAPDGRRRRWFDLQTNGTLPADLERYLLNLQVG